MSGAFAAVAGVGSFLQTIVVQTQRAIGSIIPGCAIEERHLDRLVVTQHPVETGAAIADHCYKLPSEVTLRWGWSNSNLTGGINAVSDIVNSFQAGGAASGFDSIGGLLSTNSYVKEVYNSLLALQVSGEPFTLSTGKQTYQNMMLTSLMVTTDVASENALMCVAVCQQVIIVSTAAVQSPPLSAQAQPQQTGAATSTGPQTPAQVAPGSSNASALATMATSLGLGDFVTPATGVPAP